VTGRGLAGNIRRRYPVALLYPLVGLLVVANTINLGADLGAMAAALRLLVDGPPAVYIALFATATVLAEVFIRYSRYASVLRWLTLSAIRLCGHGVRGRRALAGRGGEIGAPHIRLSGDYLTVVVAVFGTTISPYLFFWQAAGEVEDEKENSAAKPLIRAPEQAPAQMARMRIDTLVGMGFALFIMLTTAATLNAHGVTDIQTSSQAADALRPIVGRFAFTIFALGIFGMGLLAVPVLAGSAAYAIGEALKWKVGLAQRPGRARAFYGTIALATLVGAILYFTPLDPIKALFWSAVINGVIAVPVMVIVMLMSARTEVMGRFVVTGRLRLLGWAATGVMGTAVIGMIATWGR
jgi:Mn2+/Fe2+ NRAMP family transporter